MRSRDLSRRALVRAGQRPTTSDRWTTLVLPLAWTVLGGALLPLQFATNSALAGMLHSVTLTGAVSYLVGSLSLVVIVVAGRLSPRWAEARRGPSWAWLGGVAGSGYVVGSVLLTRALGAAVATSLVIAAQIGMAILLDHFGLLGLPRRRVNLARCAAVLLAFGALGVRLWGAR